MIKLIGKMSVLNCGPVIRWWLKNYWLISCIVYWMLGVLWNKSWNAKKPVAVTLLVWRLAAQDELSGDKENKRKHWTCGA